MKKVAVAVATVAALMAMALFSGIALAGDHHGDHGPKGHSSGSTQAGEKPDNTTDHNTSCTTGGGSGDTATCHSDKSSKPDASKRYGNGKTAAQIANDKGAPSGSTVSGPGNSQPHKICGRDVHAYKGGDCSKQNKEDQPKPSQQQVTFCDMETATTGSLETKNADEVAKHEFDGNPEESRDIVPPFTLNGKSYSENWDANGQAIFNAHCNAPAPPATTTTVPVTTTTTTTCASDDDQGKHESKSDDDDCGSVSDTEHEKGKVYVCHATGSATNPYVLIHISINGWINGHSHHQDGRDIFLGDKPGPCPTGSTQSTTTTTTVNTTTTVPSTTTNTVAATTTNTVATTTTEATTTTVSSAATIAPPAAPPAAPASGVKGASKTIAAPASTPAAKPSSGVLGAAKTLGRAATHGTLPFTGLQLWIVELVALGLIGAGVATRLIARRGGASS